MTTITAKTARMDFSDVLAKAAYSKDRFVITRNGKRAAAIIPIEEFDLLEQFMEYLEDQMDLRDAREALAEVEAAGGIEACCLPMQEFFEKLEASE